jgi:NitT/TauT family transport system permease protein
MTAAGMRSTRWLDGLLMAALLIGGWQLVFEYVGDVAITPPGRTVAFAWNLMAQSSFWGHAGATLAAFAYSLGIAAVLGIVGGLALGFHRFSGEVAEPILAALYTIPKVTLYPLMLLIFGLGQPAKVAFGVIHGVIPIILFTMGAVKNMNPVYRKTARILRLSPMQTATSILMPAVAPEIFTGLRVGFSLTLLGVLIGEMFASQRGLGFLIINGINSHNVRITTAVILIVIVVALAANTALLAVDRRVHRRV